MRGAALLAFFFLVSCSDEKAPTSNLDIDGVIYAAGTNDESLVALLGAPTQAERRVSVTSPTQASRVAFPATFSWSLGPATTTQRVGPGRAAPQHGWADLFVKVAHAHGSPVSGTAYFMVLAKEGKPRFRLFTKESSFQLDATQWGALEKGPYSLSVMAAVFDVGRVVNGPFAGDVVPFTIE